MRWLIAVFSLQSSPPGLVLTGMSLTISPWSCGCSSLCLTCHQPHSHSQPPPPPGCGTAASGGPMHMPSCQGRARLLLLAAQLQPLLISTATDSAHLELADAQFRSAIDTAAQAASLRRKQHGTRRQPPHLSCYPWWNPRCLMLQSQLRQASFFGLVALTFACWSAGTSLTFATAAANLISVRLWTSPSCSKPTHASFGRQLAFQTCCCP